MENRAIVWASVAVKQFTAAINYIANDSVQNAEKVQKEIVEKIFNLLLYPENYAPDKYRLKNDGSYRAFEIHHYRISYRLKKKEILIFRVRHTSQQPKKY